MNIAIIGFAFNLPGARNVHTLSDLLRSGDDACTEPAELRDHPQGWVSRAGYLHGEVEFDYPLFGFSLHDSLMTEPQQRLFIQQGWKALEQAGYNPRTVESRLGVFSTFSDSDYAAYLHDASLASENYELPEPETGTNKEQPSLLTAFLQSLTRTSPDMQQAGSGGLATVHMAIQSLLAGDCEMALVGGSSLPYPLHQGYLYRPDMNLSPKGTIRSFDSGADGTVPGFGCVCFVLKTYDRAVEDRDCIYASIVASAITDSDHQNSACTAPSTRTIAGNVSEALDRSGMSARNIDFIEAHGAGTRIGDVIEATAFRHVFGKKGAGRGRVAVSSVKSVTGHLDVAAGLAGLLKAVFQVWQGRIYPAANFAELNPGISFRNTPLQVPSVLRRQFPLTGIVTSQEMYGTHCALILRSRSAFQAERGLPPAVQKIVIGVDDPSRLMHFAMQLIAELNTCQYCLLDVAFTLARRARGKKHLFVLNASDVKDMIATLDNALQSGFTVESEPVCLVEYMGCAVLLESSELDPARCLCLVPDAFDDAVVC